MMDPDCHKRLATALSDLKTTLAEVEESNEQVAEIGEAESTIAEVEALVKPTQPLQFYRVEPSCAHYRQSVLVKLCCFC